MGVIINSGARQKAPPTVTSLTNHRGSGRVDWRQRSTSNCGHSAIDAEELVHLAESQAHRDWLKATLGREDLGEEKAEESEQQPNPLKPKPAGLTRQMTAGAEIFLEEQSKWHEKEDRERAKLLARHDAWVEAQIKSNSSEMEVAKRDAWRETQHEVEVQLQGTPDSHDRWLLHHHLPAHQMDGGQAALRRMRKSEMSSFRTSIAAAIYCQSLWRGRVARSKQAAAAEHGAMALSALVSSAWSSAPSSRRCEQLSAGDVPGDAGLSSQRVSS